MRLSIAITLLALTMTAATFSQLPPSPQKAKVEDVVSKTSCPRCFGKVDLQKVSMHSFSNIYSGSFQLRRYEFKCQSCTNQFRRWEKPQ